ncbi:MAG: adenylate cyclase [Bradyrhizobium sp.]|jgi:class 3 adenylate cyclase|nr:adenylate cyclase [Bradyrhizobium sp.]
MVFALLILPALAIVIGFSFYENVRNLTALSNRFIDRASQDAGEMSGNLLQPVAEALRLMAGAEETTPGFFRSEESSDFLYDALISAPQIDAVYTTFENGFHRVVTRVDDDRRRSDPRIPANAKWHMSFIDDFSAGADRKRHRTFYETWPTPVGGYSIDAANNDLRTTLPHYQLVRQRLALAVTDPFINPDTGHPVIALGYPILVKDNFVGVTSAHITFRGLSELLARHKASANSITVIADEHGKLLAHPVPMKAVQVVDGRLQMTDWADVDEPQIVEAVQRRAAGSTDRFNFTLERDGTEYVALFSKFPTGSGKTWQVLVVTPTADFVGELERTNRLLVWLMLVVVVVESALIYVMAGRVSKPIEVVSQAMRRIRSLSFGEQMAPRSRIREIAELQHATRLLANALRSFAMFAPIGIVRDLIESGRPIAPGMEPRFMTILFADVDGFTTLAEQLSSQELSEQTSQYFETVTSAVAEESGTIDKFIGDCVMALWGAPAVMEDHVFRACVAALRASRRMERLNASWAAEGRKQMRVRIGVHCDSVVVGNVGSRARLSYTVMGDGVNVASRIEGLNKQFGTSICISQNVYERVSDRIAARALGRVPVKGRKTEIMVYELLGIAGSNDPELAVHRAVA